MTQQDRRLSTGNPPLDDALAGGFPSGSTVLLEGEGGAGSTEFALGLLRGIVESGTGGTARFISATRSPPRVRRELTALYGDEKVAGAVDVRAAQDTRAHVDCAFALADLKPGDALVVESGAGLLRRSGGDVVTTLQHLADVTCELGATLVVLVSPGSVPPEVAASLRELADAVVTFAWRDCGTTQRRLLTIPKFRGLTPTLEGEQIPVFEVALQQGTGFAVSRVKNVM